MFLLCLLTLLTAGWEEGVVVLHCSSLPKAHDLKWVKDSTCLLWFPPPRDTSTTSSHSHERGKISVFAVLHGQMALKYQVYSIVSDLYWIQHFSMAALSTICPQLNACTYVLRTLPVCFRAVEKELVEMLASTIYCIIIPSWFYQGGITVKWGSSAVSNRSRGPLRHSQPGCRCRALTSLLTNCVVTS